MKMKLYRASGNVINADKAAEFKVLMKAEFDAVEAEVGKFNEENKDVFNTRLQAVEDEFNKDNPRSIDITLDQVPDLIEEYKCAIAITKAQIEGSEQIAAFLMDSEQ